MQEPLERRREVLAETVNRKRKGHPGKSFRDPRRQPNGANPGFQGVWVSGLGDSLINAGQPVLFTKAHGIINPFCLSGARHLISLLNVNSSD
jgi:hypothetical protein